jgi:hypothetical protein
MQDNSILVQGQAVRPPPQISNEHMARFAMGLVSNPMLAPD